MRGASFAVIVGSCALLLAADARAADVRAGWEAGTRWDSNVLNSARNEQRDVSLRTGPFLEFEQRQGEVTGLVRGRGYWEGFLDTEGANNFEYFLDARGAWSINPRNQLRFSNNLSRTDSLTAELAVVDDEPTTTGQDVEAGRSSTLRNNANLTFAHQWSRRVAFEASVTNSLFDFERDTRSDSLSTRGSMQATRTLTERMTVGIGAAFTRQDFDETTTSPESGADIVELFGIWNYTVTPTLVISATLGPALNRPDEFENSLPVTGVPTISGFIVDAGTCPLRSDGNRVFGAGCQPAVGQILGTPNATFVPLAAGSAPIVTASFLDGGTEADDSLTLFGSLAIIKYWEHSSARFFFQRRTSAASGNGASTNLTSASLSYAWEPARKWRLSAVAAWTLQTSASDFPIVGLAVGPQTLFVDASFNLVDDPAQAAFQVDGAAVSTGVLEIGSTDSAYETTSYQLQFLASRQITRRLTARGRVALFRSERSGDLQDDSTTDALRFEIGLRWEFASFRL